MGLEQAITHGKEHRKEYRGGKACCKSCRNHGGCPVCEGNRAYSTVKGQQAADAELDQSDTPYYWDDSAEEIREELCPDPTDPINQKEADFAEIDAEIDAEIELTFKQAK